ncbi:MAG: hypothetical protein ACRC1H_14520 [Caldilineaceae bacterium]
MTKPDAVREALAELVALEDMQDAGFGSHDTEGEDEYLRRKPLAWAAARAALSEQPASACACKARPATACPGEWEQGCDLGANPAFVKVADPQPAPVAEPASEPAADGLLEPYAWAVNFPDEQRIELVHDLDDLVDDLTNCVHDEPEPLYTAEQMHAHRAEADALNAIVAMQGGDNGPSIQLRTFIAGVDVPVANAGSASATPSEAAMAAAPVERPAPKRDDLPSTVFVVLDEMGIPVFCAAYPQACNDHISEAIVKHNIHSAGLWVVREYTLDTRTRSQKLADAGYTRRPSLRAMDMREALELIAAPMRPDGTWNRDREACRELAAEALGRYEDSKPPNAELRGRRAEADAEIARLRLLLSDAVSALEYHQEQTRPIHSTKVAIEALRAAIAKGEAP